MGNFVLGQSFILLLTPRPDLSGNPFLLLLPCIELGNACKKDWERKADKGAPIILSVHLLLQFFDFLVRQVFVVRHISVDNAFRRQFYDSVTDCSKQFVVMRR